MYRIKKIANFFFGPKVSTISNNIARKAQNSELALHSEIAGLKLTISELKQELINREAMLQQAENSHQEKLKQLLETKLSNLFGGLASPLAQLALQRALASEGKEIKPENIFKLLSAIENVLEEAGLKHIHQSGEIHAWNPENMSPVMPGITFTEGENVLIRLPGYVYKGKYICKSLVDKIK
jgi:molecular chaperone GrpE (heat shock protein)